MNTPEEHAAAVMRAPGSITVASIAGAIRAYAEEVKGSQIEQPRSQLETELQKHLSAAQGQIAELVRQRDAVADERSFTQEVLRVTKNALDRLSAERDAEREARRALAVAVSHAGLCACRTDVGSVPCVYCNDRARALALAAKLLP